MKLYDYFRSSTSYRVRIALNLKGVSYSRHPVNLKNHEQRQEQYLSLNPHGSVPALKTSDETLYQSLAIINWLERTYPEPSFLPERIADQQFCLELYYAIASEIHAVNNQPVLAHLKSEMKADQSVLEAWNAKWIHRTFEPVEHRLASNNWTSGQLPFGRPGLLEIVLIPQIYNARRWNTDLSAYPKLLMIEKACLEIAAFRDAHPDNQSDAI